MQPSPGQGCSSGFTLARPQPLPELARLFSCLLLHPKQAPPPPPPLIHSSSGRQRVGGQRSQPWCRRRWHATAGCPAGCWRCCPRPAAGPGHRCSTAGRDQAQGGKQREGGGGSRVCATRLLAREQPFGGGQGRWAGQVAWAGGGGAAGKHEVGAGQGVQAGWAWPRPATCRRPPAAWGCLRGGC
jgi:hypothetical protein